VSLRVVHLTTFDTAGGAARAALRIHEGLLLRGVDSTVLARRVTVAAPGVLGPRPGLEQLWARATGKLEVYAARLAGLPCDEQRSLAVFGLPVGERLRRLRPDVVQLHYVAGGLLRLESLRELAAYPVAVHLVDQWAFAATEHHAGASRAYEDGSYAGVDGWAFRRKLRAWSALPRLTAVAPSRWMADAAARSAVFRGRRVVRIATGHDLSRMRRLDAAAARRRFSLPLGARVLVFGANLATTNPFKGYDVVEQLALRLGDVPDLHLVVFGDRAAPRPLGLPATFLGELEGEALAAAYSAGDVFLAPSRQENLANTVLEAMACALPVAAFDVGGMSDAVEHEQTGYLARAGDVDDFEAGVRWLLSHPAPQALGARARAKAELEFSAEAQAVAYERLYREMVSG